MTTSWEEPVYVISVAAELADMHPQTLRQYDRLGLVVPQRQGGRQRRYSRQDVHRLRTIQQLSREGVSLEGIRRIVQLEGEVEQLQRTVAELAGQIQAFQAFARYPRVFAAGAQGDVTTTFDAGPDAEHPGQPGTRRAGRPGRRAPRPLRPAAAITAGPTTSALPARPAPGVLVWKPKR
ncbi:MerR family transcriptional regulator [Citricoccus sp. SGAir0253]|uniref:heat shock protein transcriptional repressor HspR n=1 Tax=Citricoccus sp. SGAir0253 TaxID=2567881 RepID=UPI0010CD3C39|nr:helix-turn-helix transcriptional regulator [Citricoccus sp. SGAir0253]QCU77304.1 MerR family transcriptional regulator [Citricoccus sp. SGAir0253]